MVAGSDPIRQQSGGGSVTDSQGGSVNQSFTVNVSHQAVNNAPVITAAPNFLTNLERQYQYDLTGTDPDGDLLAWGLDQAPEGMKIDPKLISPFKTLRIEAIHPGWCTVETHQYGLFQYLRQMQRRIWG